MTHEFGIILWPDALLRLIKEKNASYLPPDCKAEGFSIDAEDCTLTLHVSTEEQIGNSPVPVGYRGGELKVN